MVGVVLVKSGSAGSARARGRVLRARGAAGRGSEGGWAARSSLVGRRSPRCPATKTGRAFNLVFSEPLSTQQGQQQKQPGRADPRSSLSQRPPGGKHLADDTPPPTPRFQHPADNVPPDRATHATHLPGASRTLGRKQCRPRLTQPRYAAPTPPAGPRARRPARLLRAVLRQQIWQAARVRRAARPAGRLPERLQIREDGPGRCAAWPRRPAAASLLRQRPVRQAQRERGSRGGGGDRGRGGRPRRVPTARRLLRTSLRRG